VSAWLKFLLVFLSRSAAPSCVFSRARDLLLRQSAFVSRQRASIFPGSAFSCARLRFSGQNLSCSRDFASTVIGLRCLLYMIGFHAKVYPFSACTQAHPTDLDCLGRTPVPATGRLSASVVRFRLPFGCARC
jgi:hypothetical protein